MTDQISPTLITGATGFAGGHLVEALLASGHPVVGLSRRAVWPAEWSHLAERAPLLACDVGDTVALTRILRQTQPTHIYHLAGYASVGESFRDPDAAWAGNLNTTRALCEAVARLAIRPRILFVGSGLIYGNPPCPDHPCDEETALRPDTPYGASKAAADLACFQYTCVPGLDIVRARPFNHIGPHQSARFAIPSFARQLVAIERGESPPVLETGNLTTRRDLTDVRDTVAAYQLLLAHGRSGEAYNIGRGETISMQEVLDRLIALTGLRVEVRQSPALMRPTEPAALRVNAEKLRCETGWQPRYTLDQTLCDTLAACRLSFPRLAK